MKLVFLISMSFLKDNVIRKSWKSKELRQTEVSKTSAIKIGNFSQSFLLDKGSIKTSGFGSYNNLQT